jgi:hypothetical protein
MGHEEHGAAHESALVRHRRIGTIFGAVQHPAFRDWHRAVVSHCEAVLADANIELCLGMLAVDRPAACEFHALAISSLTIKNP